MKTNPERAPARWREQLYERWGQVLGRQPSPTVVDEVHEALERTVTNVRPTEGFRQQLGERLSMAAQSRAVGVTVQHLPDRDRLALLTSAAAVALGLVGLALLMRRLIH